MPSPFGKPCAAALDAVVPQSPQRQEAARLKLASQWRHKLFRQFLAAIQCQPAVAGTYIPVTVRQTTSMWIQFRSGHSGISRDNSSAGI
jgi:hypothetical protein